MQNDRAALTAWLNELFGLVQHMETLYGQKAAVEARFPQPTPYKRPWGWKGYALCIVIAFVVLGIPMSSSNWFVSLLALPVVLVVGVGGPLLRNRKLVPASNAKADQKNRARAESMREATAPIDAQLNEAGRIYATRFASGYPQAYAYSDAVGFVAQAVQNHRADSVGMAINLYEQVLHQQRLEQSQQAILEEQQRSRRQIAAGFVISAAMQGATIGAINRAASQPRTVHVKHY